VANLTAVLYLPTAIGAFANLSNDYTFPPGYEEAIIYNVAMRLSLEYPACGRLDHVRQMAQETMAVVKMSNTVTDLLQVDSALTGGGKFYNYLSDQGA
jgi:hypothetical protein